MRYLISDTHFGDESLIEYKQRDFPTVEAMNDELIRRWNSLVGSDDKVIVVGDLVGPGQVVSEWVSKLNGDILLATGNHDNVAVMPDCHIVQSCQVAGEKRSYHIEHKPNNMDGFWTIHGHSHDNDLANYPFINPAQKNINVSAELLWYYPIAFDALAAAVDKNQRYERVPEHYLPE